MVRRRAGRAGHDARVPDARLGFEVGPCASPLVRDDSERLLAEARRDVFAAADLRGPSIRQALASAFDANTRSIWNAYNADVASPVDVQESWKKHVELPGFAAGT